MELVNISAQRKHGTSRHLHLNHKLTINWGMSLGEICISPVFVKRSWERKNLLNLQIHQANKRITTATMQVFRPLCYKTLDEISGFSISGSYSSISCPVILRSFTVWWLRSYKITCTECQYKQWNVLLFSLACAQKENTKKFLNWVSFYFRTCGHCPWKGPVVGNTFTLVEKQFELFCA